GADFAATPLASGAAAAGPALPEVPAFPLAAPRSFGLPPCGSPVSLAEAAGRPDEFSFTLRKADGTGLGLSVAQEGPALLIEAVRSDGAVEAWNKSCAGRPERIVVPGDRIVGVNGVTEDSARMLEECESQQLLRLTVRREGAQAAAGGHEAPPATLRAEASEFVPSRSSRHRPHRARSPTEVEEEDAAQRPDAAWPKVERRETT
ncbi:unnamed protein product, partial [Prorocentrum cordatum]